MRKRIVCVSIVMAMLLTACGKKDNKRLEEDFQAINSNSETATVSDAAGDKFDAASIPKKLNYEIMDYESGLLFQVDAEVVADEIENAAVYKVNSIHMDEDYLINLASNVFDNGEYKVELPYQAMSRTELEKQLTEHMADRNGKYSADGYLNNNFVEPDVKKVLEIYTQYEQTNKAEKLDGKVFYDIDTYYDRMMTNDMNLKEDKLLCARITGMIDGVPCEIIAERSDKFDENHVNIRRTTEYSGLSSLITVYTKHSGDIKQEDLKQVNTCDLDEAKKLAESFIKKITKTDYRIYQIDARYTCMSKAFSDSASRMNGYRFYYTPAVYDAQVSYSPFYRAIDESSQMTENQPVICVDIDNTGFVQAKYLNDVTIEECLTSTPVLMSFDQIEEQAKTYMQSGIRYHLNEDMMTTTTGILTACDLHEYTHRIHRVRFSYVVVRADGKTAIVPAWIYSEKGRIGAPDLEYDVFGVNALDGSIITFGHFSSFDMNSFLMDEEFSY